MVFSVIFGIFFVLNFVLFVNGSSAAIPFTTFLALLALWFCVSTPLVFIGAYLGFKRPVRIYKFYFLYYYLIFLRFLKILFAPIKFHAKFLNKLYIQNQYQVEFSLELKYKRKLIFDFKAF